MFIKILIPLLTVLFLFHGSLHAEQTIFLVGPENAPLEFTNSNNATSGFNVEIVREALRRIGYRAVIHLYPWNRAMAMVRNGEADGIIDAAYTESRARFLIYPETPINIEKYYAYQPVTSDIRLSPDFSNAHNFSVGLLKGAAYGPHLDHLLANGSFARIEYTVVPDQHVPKLLNKRMDIIISRGRADGSPAMPVENTSKIKPVLSSRDGKPLLVSSSKTYLAFSRKNTTQDLVDQFNQALKEMQAEGYLNKVRERYELP